MTIELIYLDTGATMEVHGDKTSGLQFEGVPSARANKATACKASVKLFLGGYIDLDDEDWDTILEALELMAKEKTNVSIS